MRLTLVFVVTENYFNGDVNVDGTPAKTNPRHISWSNASKLDLGATFSQKSVDQLSRTHEQGDGRQRLLQGRHHAMT